jgi:hypothetical protein
MPIIRKGLTEVSWKFSSIKVYITLHMGRCTASLSNLNIGCISESGGACAFSWATDKADDWAALMDGVEPILSAAWA